MYTGVSERYFSFLRQTFNLSGIRENILTRTTKSRYERFQDQKTDGGSALKLQSIVACGTIQWRKACKIFDPLPEYPTLLYTVVGAGWLDAPRPRQKLATGTLCLLPRGHAYTYRSKPPGEILWFKIDSGTSWTNLIPCSFLTAPALFSKELKTLSDEFLKDSTPAEGQRLLEGYAQLIALHLRRELVNLGIPADSERLQRLEQLWKQVCESPAQDWSIERLAGASNYSRSHFHATVQRIYGIGAMEIVGKLRMKCAMDLIQNPKVKIATAAESVGYVSPYSFSRAFKRIVGLTPEHYRQSLLGK